MSVADDRLVLASDLFNLKQYDDAAVAARAGLEISPENGRLWQVLGAATWFLGQDTECLHALETASAFIPLKPLAQRILAECYAKIGKPKLARTLYRHLIRGGRCPTELLPGIAASLNRRGEFSLALRACRVLAQRQPAHHQAHFGIAFYLNRLGAHPRRLLKPLAMAMDLAPHLLHYRLNLAFVWAELRRAKTARDLIASVDPSGIFCPAWLRKMKAIFEQAEDAQGVTACERQIQKFSCGRCRLD